MNASELLPMLEHRVNEQPPAEEITKTARFSCIKLPSKPQALMVKHYTPRHFLEGFLALFGFSKAKKAWVNSHHLDLIRVPGVGSLAVCEKGFFPWYGKAFLISKFVDGVTLEQFILDNEKNKAEIFEVFQKIAAIVERMSRSQMTYGSMNASNFLVTQKGVLLTNFDKIKQHRYMRSFKRSVQNDLNYFFQNWQDNPEIKEIAMRAFESLEPNSTALEKK